MPKQGQFAKSARQKQLNNFKVKRHGGTGNTIDDQQLTDYLVVRFALTAKKRVPKQAQETMQRFLIEVGDQLREENGNLTKILPKLVNKLNSQVPWQFFNQLVDNWELLQKFLVKELPAVPLAHRLRVSEQVNMATLNKLVATALAEKGAATTLLNYPGIDAQKKRQTTHLLLTTLYRDGQINWAQVRALLSPLPYQPDPSLDQVTKDWLSGLSKQ